MADPELQRVTHARIVQSKLMSAPALCRSVIMLQSLAAGVRKSFVVSGNVGQTLVNARATRSALTQPWQPLSKSRATSAPVAAQGERSSRIAWRDRRLAQRLGC